jgi:hypothetical protein
MSRPLVFNIGLNRAGTTSLAEACTLLGLRAVHFRYEGHRLFDIVRANLSIGRRPFGGLDTRFDFFSDFAGQLCFRQVDAAYPGSRFIVTTRNLEDWLDSRERKVRKNLERSDYAYAFKRVDREGWTRERERFLADVQMHFRGRPQDLLILDIPVGLPVPGLPFPWKNVLAKPETRV